MPFFSIFKSTFLLLFILCSACAQKKEQKSTSLSKETPLLKKETIVAANRMEAYLPIIKDKKIALVTNQTSVVFKLKGHTHLVDTLLSLNVTLKKVFAPEHGFRGKADAGELVKDGLDTKTQLPIISLYGKNKKPSKQQLEGIEMVLFDIQDVGVRFYTYIATLQLVMEACAENNIPILVLDRPNPNANYIDGPTMETAHKSFLGMNTIPLVYAMTIGEYAQMVNEEAWLSNGVKADLKVIPLKNWNHKTPYALACLLYTSPSPRDRQKSRMPSSA